MADEYDIELSDGDVIEVDALSINGDCSSNFFRANV